MENRIAFWIVLARIRTEPALTSRAEPHPRGLAEQWLRKCAVRTGEAQWVPVVRAELDDFQRPQQRHINRFAGFSLTGQANGTPCGHTAHQHRRGEERLPGDHSEILEIVSGSQLADRRDEVGCHAACGVDAGSKGTCPSIDPAAKHVSTVHAVLHHLVMVKSPGRNRVGSGNAGEIACQAFDQRGSEPDRN